MSKKVSDGVELSRGGGVLPFIGYIGMCGPKGYGFSAVLVINRVSILADSAILVINRVWFLHSNIDMSIILRGSHFFYHYRKENKQKPFTNYVYGNLTLI